MYVTALTRNRTQAEALEELGVDRVVIADLDEEAWHSQIEPRQDFVLNCVGSAGGGLDGYRKSYLEGMRSVLSWVWKGRVGTLVFTGSTSVYAQDEGDWVDETSPAGEGSENGAILRGTEALLESGVPGLERGFVLRLGGIYGPDRHYLLRRAATAPETREGDEVFLNAIHVDDAVRAVWAAFESDASVEGGIFNIVDDRPTPKGEIIQYLHERLKERYTTLPASLGTGSGSAGAVRRRAGPRPSRKISNAKARDILGWKPVHADYRAGYRGLIDAME